MAIDIHNYIQLSPGDIPEVLLNTKLKTYNFIFIAI